MRAASRTLRSRRRAGASCRSNVALATSMVPRLLAKQLKDPRSRAASMPPAASSCRVWERTSTSPANLRAYQRCHGDALRRAHRDGLCMGIKPVTGKILDLGVIYIAIPHATNPGPISITSRSRLAAAPRSGRTAHWVVTVFLLAGHPAGIGKHLDGKDAVLLLAGSAEDGHVLPRLQRLGGLSGTHGAARRPAMNLATAMVRTTTLLERGRNAWLPREVVAGSALLG